MRRTPLFALALALFLPGSLMGQDGPASTEGKGFWERYFFVKSEGWGGSVVTSLGAFHLNGDYQVLSAGVGLGVSHKAAIGRSRGYPSELGIYFAPQIAQSGGDNATAVSLLAQWSFVRSFGIGFGFRFWEAGVGTVSPNKERAFFTLGFGLTNEKR